jgi:transposase
MKKRTDGIIHDRRRDAREHLRLTSIQVLSSSSTSGCEIERARMRLGMWKVVVRKQLRRGQVLKFFASLQPCLIGMEACATAQALCGVLFQKLIW